MKSLTIGAFLNIASVFAFGVFQMGMALYYANNASRFATDPQLNASVTSMYATASGILGMGGMVTCMLSTRLLAHEGRIRQLEQKLEHLSSQEPTATGTVGLSSVTSAVEP
jgi:hypothetical protein